jgi:putative holliday junction resolvase
VRVLGLDIGERRIGVAISDPEQRVASPLCVLDASVLRDPQPIVGLLAEYEAERLVIGLPLSLDGTEGPQATRVREVGTRLAQAVGMDVDFIDERLSSVEASRAMSAAGFTEREKRGRVDMVAAALFLQSYLDRRAGSPSAAEADAPQPDTSPDTQLDTPLDETGDAE